MDRIKRIFYLAFLAMIAGVLSGVAAFSFQHLAAGFIFLFQVIKGNLHSSFILPGLILIPAVGGLVLGWFANRYGSNGRGQSIPEIIEAAAVPGKTLSLTVSVREAITSAFCIGYGGSVGQVGPIVQLAVGFVSGLAKMLKLQRYEITILMACAASGGVAASFFVPFAGLFFVLEVILQGSGYELTGYLLISSFAAALLFQYFSGHGIPFEVPQIGTITLTDFWALMLVACLAGLLAAFYIKIFYKIRSRYSALNISSGLRACSGGILLGITGIYVPQVTGLGFSTISDLLQLKTDFFMALLLFFLKILAVSITFGSGGAGGLFAPSLFLGASLGAAAYGIIHLLLLGVALTPQLYPLAGMATFLAASFHAPVTGTLIVIELTRNFWLAFPLLTACFIAGIIAKGICSESIFTGKLDLKKKKTDSITSLPGN